MEIGIVIIFVIITIITSVIRSATKSASKSGAPPRPIFPTLSVDQPAQRPEPIQAAPQRDEPRYYSEGQAGGLESRLNDPYAAAYESSQPAVYSSMETAGGSEGATDYVKPADILPEIKATDADLTELKPDIPLRDARDTAPLPAAVQFDRLRFFTDRTEVAKAVIYSEILRPKFKSR